MTDTKKTTELSEAELDNVVGAGPFDKAEAGTGQKLGGVKVHTGASASDTTGSMGANATPKGETTATSSRSGPDIAHEVPSMTK